MKVVKSLIFCCVLLGLVMSGAATANGKTTLYRFQFLTQGANAFAPAKSRRIQLRFLNSPKIGVSTTTDTQGVANFRLERCNEEDNA